LSFDESEGGCDPDRTRWVARSRAAILRRDDTSADDQTGHVLREEVGGAIIVGVGRAPHRLRFDV
jgi:hypothetical protein